MITAKEYLAKGIDNLGTIMSPVENFSTRFAFTQVAGNSLQVPVVAGGTAVTKSAAGAYTLTGGPEATGVDVTLNHVYVPFVMDVYEANASEFGQDLMNKFATAAEALGEKALQLALADTTNFTLTDSISGSAFDADDLGTITTTLDSASVSPTGRAFLADSVYSNALLPASADNMRVRLEDYGLVDCKLTAGILPSGVNAVALGKSSYAIAAAYPTQDNNGKFIVWEDVTTEQGIPVRVKVWEEPHGLQGIVETRIGGKVAISNKGIKIANP